MTSIEQFNALDGKRTSRNDIIEILNLSIKEMQLDVFVRLDKLLKDNPSATHFDLNLETSAEYLSPEHLKQKIELLDHELSSSIPYVAFENEEITGLGKPVSSDDIYNMITNKVLDLIKSQKGLFWRKTWTQQFNGLTSQNFVSKKNYRGINAFMLNVIAPLERSERDLNTEPYWLTFKQIEVLNGKLKKGSKGQEVVYFTKLFRVKQEEPKIDFGTYNESKFKKFIKENKNSINDTAKVFYIPILKYYNVYNSVDITDVKFPKFKPAEQPKEPERIAVAEKIIKHYPNPPKYKLESPGDRAFYTPAFDKVTMPKLAFFDGSQEYYSTFFHEIIHSTGHHTRLKRNFEGKFGSKKYAFEELVAELGALFLCAESGIMYFTLHNSAAYLKGWQKRLEDAMKSDNKFFFKASSKAQAAADLILNRDKNGVPKYTKDKSKKSPQKKNETPQLALFGYTQTEILEVSNKYKGESNSFVLKELKKAFASFNGKKFKNLELDEDILINRISKKKTIFGGKRIDSVKATAISYLPHLLIYGKVLDKGRRIKSHHKKMKATSILLLESKIKIDGKTKYYVITVFETARGHLKYFIEESNIKKSVRLRNGKAQKQSAISNRQNKDTKNKSNTTKSLGTIHLDFAPNPIPEKTAEAKEGYASAVELDKQIENLEVIQPKIVKPDIKNDATDGVVVPGEETRKKSIPNKYKTASQSKQDNSKPRKWVAIENDDLQKFLGGLEIKPIQSLAVTLDSGEGGGKTHTFYQWANIMQNSGLSSIIWSLEQHESSSLSIGLAEKYFLDGNIDKIAVESEREGESKEQTYDRLLESIKDFDAIFIDSWAKVTELNSRVNFDQDFRKAFNGKIFFIIFQRTSDGKMRSGSKGAFDGDIILKVEVDRDNFKNNYVFNHKNRYNEHSPISELRYSPYYQRLLLPGENEEVGLPTEMTL